MIQARPQKSNACLNCMAQHTTNETLPFYVKCINFLEFPEISLTGTASEIPSKSLRNPFAFRSRHSENLRTFSECLERNANGFRTDSENEGCLERNRERIPKTFERIPKTRFQGISRDFRAGGGIFRFSGKRLAGPWLAPGWLLAGSMLAAG